MMSRINVGTGTGLSILEAAQTIAQVTGFTGTIRCDTCKPDGTARKLMDVTRLERMGWNAHIGLRDGLERTFAWYKQQLAYGAVMRAK
ncbi:hypothetical protein [Tateyamaria sp.]|uniref:hypothetical protein n=1 Tax=Tateyamaria sp. TaxID=1929288 RepID=UPI0032A0BB60